MTATHSFYSLMASMALVLLCVVVDSGAVSASDVTDCSIPVATAEPTAPFIAGNWKLNPETVEEALKLVRDVAEAYNKLRSTARGPVPEVAVFPPFPFISIAVEHGASAGLRVGAQNIAVEQGAGAFTGEVSARMVQSVGAEYVLIGHSERRQLYAETDVEVNRKARVALAAGLRVVLCVGESEADFLAGKLEAVTARQVQLGLQGLTTPQLKNVTIAYEPVWAIGTGRSATPDQAQLAHAAIRASLASLFGKAMARHIRILYGGSVKPDTAGALLRMPDVDGTLVGGASLDAAKFSNIAGIAERLVDGDTSQSATNPATGCRGAAGAGVAEC